MLDRNITKEKLILILQELDKKRDFPIVLVAIGGTALSLLDLKTITEDVDFVVESESLELKNFVTADIFGLGYYADVFFNREIVGIIHPPADYIKKGSIAEISSSLKNIRVVILSPIDIIITKLPRYVEKYQKDIQRILIKYHPSIEKIEKRFKQYLKLYSGQKEEFELKFETFKQQYKLVMSAM